MGCFCPAVPSPIRTSSSQRHCLNTNLHLSISHSSRISLYRPVRTHIARSAFGVERPAMQRADDFSQVEHAGSKRAAAVGALVIHGIEFSLHVVECKFTHLDVNG